ncbi:HXXEE domain-containing protein [Streptococcus panodentis]|uniref:HXXEE domain-containing protein n=1 Tax=Streptococcus panodentis TaxID=1581472 RepID=A0ABS5AZK4_9STRE|nr:HXXEE domain-containing protein [Streptococcus panodentis]MBP2622013.1 HXXEE domain-containing protein [Streptococcus panodentis]
MIYFINKWYQLGTVLFILISVSLLLFRPDLSVSQYLMTFQLLALFAHQFEEYQFPGGASPIINIAIYDEKELADRFPGNTLSIMLVNTIAWLLYASSILFSEAYWMGIGISLFSLSQLLGHGFQMNHRLNTWYNPGLLTTVFLFIPTATVYLVYVCQQGLVTGWDWILGLIMFVSSILMSIILPVQLLKDKKTRYVISKQQMDKFHQITKLAKRN